MLVLSGIVLVVVGFAARIHPLPLVVVAALITALAAGDNIVEAIALLGRSFNDTRAISIVWLVLPAVGVLERAGLKARARAWIGTIRQASPGRLLSIYFVIRQATAALGLTSLGGHAQMVRPLIAPMAEGAAEAGGEPLTPAWRQRIRAQAAAVDNIALFFGEDLFVAIGSILLIVGFLAGNGITVAPLALALWAAPTAVAAALIQLLRLRRFDRRLDAARAAGRVLT